jgi:hypothetical protein
VENEDLVNAPNWLPLTFRIDGGDWFTLDAAAPLSYWQELDLRRGVLTRTVRVQDGMGRTTLVTQRRLVSMDDPHLAALETTIVPEDWSGRLEIRSALDGRVVNAGVARYQELSGEHLHPDGQGADGEAMWLRTRAGQQRLHQPHDRMGAAPRPGRARPAARGPHRRTATRGRLAHRGGRRGPDGIDRAWNSLGSLPDQWTH